MRLVSIAAGTPFLDQLAQRWLDSGHERGLILLPTRRAARALADSFLRATDGRPMLLPRITALGALDEIPLALAGALDLPPAVDQMRRLAELARLVLALPVERGGVPTADSAWMLARELAQLMDEAERAELDLHAALLNAAEGDYATHWQVTLRFLEIVTQAWPEWLATEGLCNPAWRQVKLLRTQSEQWRARPPLEAVWVAGVTGGIPAAGDLVRVVAGLPTGLVFLQGVDFTMPDEQWETLEAAHPQAGLARLLERLGARRGDVEFAEASGRFGLLATALAPATALSGWNTAPAPGLEGLSLLSPPDTQAEATAIAMVLRDALETPGTRAALVTPDRALAGRVATELLRWGVVADDSAGEQLAETPPAVFLRLLARAVAEDFAPVALLALLKHPFAACGMAPAACRAAARKLEEACLRGPRPLEGLAGLREVAERKGAEWTPGFLARLEACLDHLLRPDASVRLAPAEHLAGLIRAAEALAGTDMISGPAVLWSNEEGETLAAHLASALDALVRLPDQAPRNLPGLLDALLEGTVVRSRRALRGRGGTEHPRVFIWGLLEARLQSVDIIVLGGLVEGVWPLATDPGPWMSRPMRLRAGLPSPEEAVGQAAHDFVMAACSAPVVVLSCPRRRDGAPAVPSRWLLRLEAFLAGRGMTLPRHPASDWAAVLDMPRDGQPTPVVPPRPCPPLTARPTRLSVTAIDTWLADPYAIYARHILRLRKLDPLEQATDAADYGSIVHAGMHKFAQLAGADWPPDAHEKLRAAMLAALAEARLRPALREWWEPRLLRIADWVAEQEAGRRSHFPTVRIGSEVEGKWLRDGFELVGRADRIEMRRDGTLALLDYKTGRLPAKGSADSGDAPQLPLEAAMAEFGAFGADFMGSAAELTYWHLSGAYVAGDARPILEGKPGELSPLIAHVSDSLDELIRDYRNPARPYLSQPHPGRMPRFSDYAQLARVAEWGGGNEPE